MQTIKALLPMKGNSERVPNKNIRNFAGEPLFFKVAHLLENSEHVDEFFINTDSDKIATLAQDNFKKVRIIERPKEICGDYVSMNEIIKHDLSQIDSDLFVQTHSTNPILSDYLFNKACEQFLKSLDKYQSLFSVTRFQTRLYDHNKQPLNHNPEDLIRTQDLPVMYEENSNLYFFTRESFKNANYKRIGKSFDLFEMDPKDAIDIDNEDDFLFAEEIFKLRNNK